MDSVDGGLDLELRHRVESAFRTLRPIHQEMLTLTAVHKLTYAEVAGRLGISMAEVERRLADAIYLLDRAAERGGKPWWRRLW
ncbi:MAG: RNA polymerase sigma factor [Allosphingosinicella sp.]|uniref:RNA polymerase sigma factor n=1 Tax=Allosphingosinicella sp. TaxID=2823234 RepID=UPI00393CEF5D